VEAKRWERRRPELLVWSETEKRKKRKKKWERKERRNGKGGGEPHSLFLLP
jgi:hypothetical protein